MGSAIPGDLTAQARIRDAALELFGRSGIRAATVREIAKRAGVSPALVLHHYGSKEGLRQACDDYLVHIVSDEKMRVFSGAPIPEVMTSLDEHPEFARLWDYLLRLITEGGPAAESIFDRMIARVTDYLAVGEAHGLVRPFPDAEARAAISTAMSFGLLVFQRQIARHLGGERLIDPDVLRRYTAFTLDLFTHGLLTRPITTVDGASTAEATES